MKPEPNDHDSPQTQTFVRTYTKYCTLDSRSSQKIPAPMPISTILTEYDLGKWLVDALSSMIDHIALKTDASCYDNRVAKLQSEGVQPRIEIRLEILLIEKEIQEQFAVPSDPCAKVFRRPFLP